MFDWERLADFIARRQTLLHAGEWLFAARRKLATWAMSLLVVMLAYHVVFGVNGMMAYHNKRGENQKLQQDILRLQQENDRVSRRVRELKTDPKAIEREAREQLKYARSGEVVYVAPEPPQSSATAQKR
jgi:cell division protein FtsB